MLLLEIILTFIFEIFIGTILCNIGSYAIFLYYKITKKEKKISVIREKNSWESSIMGLIIIIFLVYFSIKIIDFFSI